MDIQEVKDINRWNTEKHDSYIGIVLPMFVEAVKGYCGNPFTDENGVESLPGSVRVAVAKWIEFNVLQSGVSGRSQGVSYSYETQVPDSIKMLLQPHRRLKF